MIYIYNILGIILIPLIKLNVLLRIYQKKEMALRYKERFGISNEINNNNKKIIWIHAASIGEFKSADYLINKYNKNFTLLITTTTLSAANYAIKNYGDLIIHQFAPLDISFWIKKFLKKWNPKLIIWIESDLWPVTLKKIKEKNINAILINLRLSPKSLKRWSLMPSFYNNLLDNFSYIFAQSKIDQERIQLLSSKKVKFIGNLKFTNKDYDLQKNRAIKLKSDPNIITIMLCSTHYNEEFQMLPVIKNIQNEFKNIRFIIAPRHPERSKEIINLCKSYNLTAQLESEKNLNQNNIIVINSFGILSHYFKITDIAFLGGSLIPAGGHNPIEPAYQKCAIITGHQLFNWQNIFDDMIKNNACLKINSMEELKNNLKNLINNKNIIEAMKTNAYNFSQKQFFDMKSLEKIIDNLMNL